jgi:hypothetical protein
MSTALAISATMRVIASMLDAGVSAAQLFTMLGTAATTVQSPDLNAIGDQESDHLNLFLYTVTMNSGWRNSDLMRNPAGDRTGKPPLALDLHFMLSAYGKDQYHPEFLLGIGMQVLHEQSFLDRNAIRSLFNGAVSLEDQAMATAQLDQQIEQIKISPHDLSADELYKLWSAFGSKCRPSAAYVATVVLIESRVAVQSAPPVLSRNLGVVTFEQPSISRITPAVFTMGGGAVQVRLDGSGFQTPGNIAMFGNTAAAFDTVGATFALVTVPASVLPGTNLLRIVRRYSIGQAPDKLIADSNPIPFIVQPVINGITKPIVDSLQRIVVAIVPNCTSDQVATLLLDQINVAPGVKPHRYTIDALPEDIAGASISFDASTVAGGTYLVRIRIAGTESVPAFDPGIGFTGPTVSL